MKAAMYKTLRLISRYRSEIMGLAILWIMLFHGLELYKGMHVPIVSIIGNRGNLGVDIFLFLSGFGLYFSMSKDSSLGRFYKKRAARLLIPYLSLAIPYFIYDDLGYSHFALNLIKDLTGISFVIDYKTTVWYIFLIAFLYIVFPLVFRLAERHGAAFYAASVIGVTVAAVILRLAALSVYENTEIMLLRIPVFLIGTAAAHAYKNHDDRILTVILVYTVVSLLTFFSCAAFTSGSRLTFNMLYRLGSGGAMIVFMSVLVNLRDRLAAEKLTFLTLTGSLTLELYLLHIFIRNIMDRYAVGFGFGMAGRLLTWTAAVAICIVLAYLLHKLFDLAANKLIGEKKQV